jgi:hypothetical protein
MQGLFNIGGRDGARTGWAAGPLRAQSEIEQLAKQGLGTLVPVVLLVMIALVMIAVAGVSRPVRDVGRGC